MKEKIYGRTIYEAVRIWRENKEKCLGEVLLSVVRKRIGGYYFPDEVRVLQNIAGGRPRVVVVKKLKKPTLGAWSDNWDEDMLCVAIGDICGYVGDGFFSCVFVDLRTRKVVEDINVYKNEKFKFYTCRRELMEKLLNILSRYVVFDVDDIKGCVIRAIYVIGVRDDSPNGLWNEAAKEYKRMEEEEIRKREEEWKKHIEQKQKEAIKLLAPFAKNIEFYSENIGGRDVPKCRCEIEGKTYSFLVTDAPDVKKKYEKYKEEKEIFEKHQKYLEEKVLTNAVPIFECGGFKVYVKDLLQGVVKIPKNLIPHFIGRKGEGIKTFEKLVKKRIKIIPADEYPVGKKDKICRLRLLPEPTFDV